MLGLRRTYYQICDGQESLIFVLINIENQFHPNSLFELLFKMKIIYYKHN